MLRLEDVEVCFCTLCKKQKVVKYIYVVKIADNLRDQDVIIWKQNLSGVASAGNGRCTTPG